MKVRERPFGADVLHGCLLYKNGLHIRDAARSHHDVQESLMEGVQNITHKQSPSVGTLCITCSACLLQVSRMVHRRAFMKASAVAVQPQKRR